MRRATWNAVWFLFASWTPPAFHPWRRCLLRLFGAKIASVCDVRGSAKVWYPPNLRLAQGALIAERVNCYNMAMVNLGENALVSQGAHLCAGNHDIDSADFQLIAKPINLGPRSWVAADAFVAPGVTLGEGSVLGARAAAFADLQPWTLYIGNPAQAKRARKRPGNDAGSG
jgi:putative colanic acid biosynthesis acetyltransferase WcaF